MYLNEFKPLLNELYKNYLSQPMEGQDKDRTVAVNSDIPDDSPDKAKERVEWNKSVSPETTYQGKVIYRRNHGLAHTIRSMIYAPMVIEYLACYGKGDLKKEATKLKNDADGIKKIMLLGAFSSIARTSEIDFSVQPEAHQYYRRKAGEIFESYYQKVLNGEANDDIKKLFKLFQGEKEFIRCHAALVAMGNDNNFDPIHIILNICHKLDLYRCRAELHAQKSVDSYIRKYSEGNYGEAFWALINQSIDIIEATGDQVVAKRIRRKDNDNNTTFLACNSSVDRCVSMLQSVPVQKVPVQPSDDNNPWLKPFFFKSIRTDGRDFWMRDWDGTGNGYIYWITPTPINCDPHPPNRIGDKKKFTVKMVRDNGKFNWKVVERKDAQPMYSAKEKRGFSKASSLSYARPLQGYEPKVCNRNRTRRDCLVGIRLEENKVLINRIMIYDTRTVVRPYDRENKQEAKEFLSEKRANKIYWNSLDELVQSGLVGTYNEVLGRVHYKISAIVIFSYNLQSRLLAQLRARQYEKRLKERAEELREPFDASYVIPIVYYISNDPKNHTVYNEGSQKNDRLAAKNKQFDPDNDDATKCEKYLKELEDLKNEPSFIEENEIKQVHILAARGDKKALAKHLEANPNDINLQDKQGKTAAHYAAQNNHVEILKLLKKKGDASVFKVKNKKDLTPFTAAIDKKNKEVIEYFLKKGIFELDTFEQLIKLINCSPEDNRLGLLQRYKAQWLKDAKLIQDGLQLKKLTYSLKPKDKKTFLSDQLVFQQLKNAFGGKWLKNNKFFQANVNLHKTLNIYKPNNRLQFLRDVFDGKWLKDHTLTNTDLDKIFNIYEQDDRLQFLRDIFGDKWPQFLKAIIADGKWLKDILADGKWLRDNSIQNVSNLQLFLGVLKTDDQLVFLRDVLGGEWLKDNNLIKNVDDFESLLRALKKEDDRLVFLKDVLGGEWLKDNNLIEDPDDLKSFLKIFNENDRLVLLKKVFGIKWLVDKKILSGALGISILNMLNEKQRLELSSDPLIVKSGLFNEEETFEEFIRMLISAEDQITRLTTPGVFEKLPKQKDVLNYKIHSFLSQLAQDEGYDYKTRYKNIIDPNATLQDNIINILRKPISSYSPVFFLKSYIGYNSLLRHALRKLEEFKKTEYGGNNLSPKELESAILYIIDRSHINYGLPKDNIENFAKSNRAEQTFMRRIACCYQMVRDNIRDNNSIEDQIFMSNQGLNKV